MWPKNLILHVYAGAQLNNKTMDMAHVLDPIYKQESIVNNPNSDVIMSYRYWGASDKC